MTKQMVKPRWMTWFCLWCLDLCFWNGSAKILLISFGVFAVKRRISLPNLVWQLLNCQPHVETLNTISPRSFLYTNAELHGNLFLEISKQWWGWLRVIPRKQLLDHWNILYHLLLAVAPFIVFCGPLLYQQGSVLSCSMELKVSQVSRWG